MNPIRPLIATLGALVLAVSLASAHPGHGEEITREFALKRAGLEVERLVEETKLEKSWALEREVADAERRVVEGEVEWIVAFHNPKAADAGKRKLFVFLSASGDYLAANFTGK